MNKLKLLLTTCALFLLGGANSAWAQKDVTSQYITNATLSSLDGWTNVNFNTPVQGNNTTGYAVECYEGWGTVEKSNYSLTQKITLPVGHYTLVNYSFFREGEAYNTDASISRAYLKAGDNQVLVKTLGSITAAGYANSQAEGANAFDSKMYRNTLDFNIDADNTEIEIGVYGTFNTEITKSWMILGMFELIDNDTEATMDAPFDVTGYITNPGFEYRDMTGWTLSENDAFGTQNNNQSFKVGGYYAEKWQASTAGALSARSMSQKLTDLPAGYYKLTANLGGDGTYVDLNGKTANWTEDKDYTVGYVLAENENLTITAGKTAEGTANWIHFDNFRLQFCGDVAAALTTLCEQVTSYNGVIPTAAYSALQTNVANYNKTYSDVDELLAAIDAVQALYENADKLKAPYASWLDLKAKAETLQAVENDNAEANSTLASAITDQTTAVDAATTAEGITTTTATLKAAMTTYVGVANPVGEGDKFDCTFLMTNPDLTNFAAWTSVDNVDGWYSDMEDGNKNTQKSDGVACAKGNAFFEYWSGTAKANNQFALYNKVENLPEGTYTINCYALATANGVEGATNSAVYFYANDTQGSLVAADVLTEQSISFVNTTTQDVKIGLKTLTGNEFRWMGIGYVELYKVPAAAPVDLNEAEAYDYTYDGAATAKLTREIYEGFNTVMLPFSLTASEIETVFGEGTLYSFTGADAGKLEFATSENLAANTPYLFKATAAKSLNAVEIEARTFVAATAAQVATTGTDYNFVGTYTPYAKDADANPIVAGADYVLGADNNFHLTTVKNALKAFRAYIQANEATEESPARLAIVIDGETTSIEAIDGRVLSNDAIYNLAGQKVKNAQKGIYIQNGKKIVVK